MKLKRQSWIVRWAYWGDKIPSRTSLCAIFWLSILLQPLHLLVVGVILPIGIGMLIWGFLTWLAGFAQAHAVGVLVTLLVFAVLSLIAFFVGQFSDLDLDVKKHIRGSVLWQGAKAVKQQVCPIVDIE